MGAVPLVRVGRRWGTRPRRRALILASLSFGIAALVFPSWALIAIIAADASLANQVLGLVCASALGLALGLAGAQAAWRCRYQTARRMAEAGVALSLLWPVLLIGWYRHQTVSNQAAAEAGLIRRASLAVSMFALDWSRAERAREPLPRCDSDALTYLGGGLQPSPELESISSCLIVVCSGPLPGTRGRFVGFADGSSRFVEPYELKAVRETDANTRTALHYAPLSEYWASAAEAN